jgi:Protein of unknown function (DUF2855)
MTPSDTGLRLFIRRGQLDQTRLGPDPDAPAARPLRDGEARLAVDHFALTANNITYAAFGEAMKYWQFFPAPDAGEGCLPVWGFATVTESRCDGVGVGRRVWGYYPAGTHLVVTPGRVKAGGFVDAAPHRAELAGAYQQYAFTDADPGWKPGLEGLQAVLRPLFVTSFLIDDFLADNDFFGARQLLLSSASSKTAYGTAFCLAQRRGQPGAPRTVGLTSAGNQAFAQSLGCYDVVLRYDDIDSLAAAVPTVYVDFSGDAPLRREIHGHFDGTLMHSSSIGGTHWQALGSGAGLPGPRPTLFFAPAQIKKRSTPPPEGWGAEAFNQRLGAAWAAFIAQVSDAREPWLQIVNREGSTAVVDAYLALLQGRADAREGLMLRLRP